MISLSKQWSLLSKTMYRKGFIHELANFLQNEGIESVLECGCGDGHILTGLGSRGLKCFGIDGSKEMIDIAKKENAHPNVYYEHMDWLKIEKIDKSFDAVICRGNSIPLVVSWDKENLDPKIAEQQIQKSVGLFFSKLNENGLLYIDTTSQLELDKGGGEADIKTKDINLRGKLTYDWKNRLRYFEGGGTFKNTDFMGSSVSYLMKPNELEDIIKSFNPSKVWKPKLRYEVNYDIICARNKN